MDAVKVFKIHPDARLPYRASDEAAGYDICAVEGFSLKPGERVVVPTGLVIQPPPGYHFEILDRSGMAFKHNIMLINGVGLVDRDYAGEKDEVKVMLYRAPLVWFGGTLANVFAKGNIDPVSFEPGERVAQIVFRKTYVPDIVEVSQAPKEIDRGGLGSTGTK